MSQFILEKLQEAIREEGIDGWLFYNFHHRDSLADELLGIDAGLTNSRPWVYMVPAIGLPVKIVHAIESTILDKLPGTKQSYSGKEAFHTALQQFSGKCLAAHLDTDLPVISFLDAGTQLNLEKAGIKLVSAASLIQRIKGLLSESDLDSHKRAAESLYDIVEETWNFASQCFHNNNALYEGDLQNLILAAFKYRGLITDHPPIVAAGLNAGNPHYEVNGRGSIIQRGDVIQLDLWAKEQGDRSIFADISWVGYYEKEIPQRISAIFQDLIDSRERAIQFITEKLNEGIRPSGAAVDKEVRKFLVSRGYENAIKHRTGHGIDTECHGSGVNIDSVEFPDERKLLDGACFSIEPGLYFKDFGFRTEIDVYIYQNQANISGKNRQFVLLTP